MMEDKRSRHKQLLDKLHETYIIKNRAYGDSFGKTFKELGLISAITRISDKYNRLISLTNGAKNDIIDESFNDTLMDLANYCIMTVIENEYKENE